MIKLKQFHTSDIVKFKPKLPFENMKADLEIAVSEYRYELSTLWRNDDIIGIAGLFNIRPGVAELFMLPSILVDKYPLEFFKATKDMVEFCMRDYHRLQLTVDAEWKLGKKWARMLGFTEEGLMKAYSANKQDEYMFARVS